MGEVSTIGLDLAKHVFQVHGASASGAVVARKKLRREQVLTFFAGQPQSTYTPGLDEGPQPRHARSGQHALLDRGCAEGHREARRQPRPYIAGKFRYSGEALSR